MMYRKYGFLERYERQFMYWLQGRLDRYNERAWARTLPATIRHINPIEDALIRIVNRLYWHLEKVGEKRWANMKGVS